MKIQIKDKNTLEDYVSSGGTKKISDQIEYLISQLAGKEIHPSSVEIIINGDEQTPIFTWGGNENLGAFYNSKIDPFWVESYDLEDNNLYACRTCNYTVNEDNIYELNSGKIYDEATDSYRKILWKDKIAENDTTCPICFGQKTFVKINKS